MNRILIFLLSLMLLAGGVQAQKISEFPTYSGDPDTAWVPIVLLNTNRKISAKDFFNYQLATKSTTNLPEGSRLYYTDARARAAHSAAYGVIYDPSTGVIKLDTALLNALYSTSVTVQAPLTYIGGTLGLDKTINTRLAKVVPDANYTITPNDAYIVLPDPASGRTLTLPAASTMKELTIKIYCAANVNGEWTFSGSYLAAGFTGSSPLTETAINAQIPAITAISLTSINDNGTWRWAQL